MVRLKRQAASIGRNPVEWALHFIDRLPEAGSLVSNCDRSGEGLVAFLNTIAPGIESIGAILVASAKVRPVHVFDELHIISPGDQSLVDSGGLKVS